MRDRISIERPGEPQNDGGTEVPGEPFWVQTRVAAEVATATTSRLTLFANQVQAQASHIVKVRHGLTWRVELRDEIVWHDPIEGDRRLRILGTVNPDGRRIELLIAAEERRERAA